MRRNISLILFGISLLLILTAGCTQLYTQDQVNATVASKIREVASYQKVNVTVETVIIKEYVVVTPTLAPTNPVNFPTYATFTPVGFNRYTADDLFGQIAIGGYQIQQFYYDLELSDFGRAGDTIKSARNFAIRAGHQSYNGILFTFDSEKDLEAAYAILSVAPSRPNATLIRIGNFLIEMEEETPHPILDLLREIGVHFAL